MRSSELGQVTSYIEKTKNRGKRLIKYENEKKREEKRGKEEKGAAQRSRAAQRQRQRAGAGARVTIPT